MENVETPLPEAPQESGNNPAGAPTPVAPQTPVTPQGGINWKKIGIIGLVVAVLAVVAYFGQNAFFKGSLFDLNKKKFSHNPTLTEEFFPNALTNVTNDITAVRIDDKDKTTSPFGDKLVLNVMQGLDHAYFQGKVTNFFDEALVKTATESETDEALKTLLKNAGEDNKVDTTMQYYLSEIWQGLAVDVIAANVAFKVEKDGITSDVKGPLLVAKSNTGKLTSFFAKIDKLNGIGSVTEYGLKEDQKEEGGTNVFGDGVFQTLSHEGDPYHNGVEVIKTTAMGKMIGVYNADNINLVTQAPKHIKVDATKLQENAIKIQIQNTNNADTLTYDVATDQDFTETSIIDTLAVDLVDSDQDIIARNHNNGEVLAWKAQGGLQYDDNLYFRFAYEKDGKAVNPNYLVVQGKLVEIAPAGASDSVKVQMFAGDDNSNATNLVAEKDGVLSATVNYLNASENIFKIKWEPLTEDFITAIKGDSAITINILASDTGNFSSVQSPPVQVTQPSLAYFDHQDFVISKAQLDTLKNNYNITAANYDLYFRVDAVNTSTGAVGGEKTAKSAVYKVSFIESGVVAAKEYVMATVEMFAGDGTQEGATNLLEGGKTSADINYKKTAVDETKLFKIKWAALKDLDAEFIDKSASGSGTTEIAISISPDLSDPNIQPFTVTGLKYDAVEEIFTKAKLDEIKSKFTITTPEYDLSFQIFASHRNDNKELTAMAKSGVYQINFIEEAAPAAKDYTLTMSNGLGQYLAPGAVVPSSDGGTKTAFEISSDIFSQVDASVQLHLANAGNADFAKPHYSVNVTAVKGKTIITEAMLETAALDPNVKSNAGDNFYFRLVALNAQKQTVGISETAVLKYGPSTYYLTTHPYGFEVVDLPADYTVNIDNGVGKGDITATKVHFELPAGIEKKDIEKMEIVAYSQIDKGKLINYSPWLGIVKSLNAEEIMALKVGNDIAVTNSEIATAIATWKATKGFDTTKPFYLHVIMEGKEDAGEYSAFNYQPIMANLITSAAPVGQDDGTPKPAAPEKVAIRAFCVNDPGTVAGEEVNKLCFVQYNDFLLIGSPEVTEASINAMHAAKGSVKLNILTKNGYQHILKPVNPNDIRTGFTHMSEATETTEIGYLPEEIGAKSFNARGFLLEDTTFYLHADMPSSIALDGVKPMSGPKVWALMKENFYKFASEATITSFLNEYKYVAQANPNSMPDIHVIVDVILHTVAPTKEGTIFEEVASFLALVSSDADSDHPVTEEDAEDGGDDQGEDEEDDNSGSGGSSSGGGSSGGGSSGGGGGGGGGTPKKIDKKAADGSATGGETAGGAGGVDLKKHILAGAPETNLECLAEADDVTVFQDVHKDNPAYEAINFLASTASLATAKSPNQPIVVGYPLNKDLVNLRIFKANNEISRSEFLKLALVTNCVYDIKDAAKEPKNFPDIVGHWASNVINLAYMNGYITGYTNGDFGPNDSVTRAQALKILLAIKGQAMFDYDASLYSDIKSGDWYAQIVTTAYNEGLLDNITQFQADKFEPNKPITRAESAMLIKNTYDYMVKVEEIVNE